jgi:hypothetical protein
MSQLSHYDLVTVGGGLAWPLSRGRWRFEARKCWSLSARRGSAIEFVGRECCPGEFARRRDWNSKITWWSDVPMRFPNGRTTEAVGHAAAKLWHHYPHKAIRVSISTICSKR